jgi:hypothetical protein
MSRNQRIIDRCPRFYKAWEKDSVVSLLIKTISGELDKTDDAVTDLLRTHWVDTAEKADLYKIGVIVGIKRSVDEDDDHLRSHLKKAVDEYKGGGTISAILKEFQDVFKKDEITIIENPQVDSFAEFEVVANDTWTLGSNSINNEQSTLSLTVKEKGEISNPIISNLDTGQSITYQGKLKTNEQLVIKQGSALLNGKDVAKKVVPLELPHLLRKGSKWKYSEELLEGIGIFDKGRFDEHTFSLGVPTVKIRYEWTRCQPATFQLNIKSEALSRSGLTEDHIKERANYLKAAGINVIVKLME